MVVVPYGSERHYYVGVKEELHEERKPHSRGATTTEKLRGTKVRVPTPGQRPGWVLDAGGGRSLPLWGSGGITPGKFFENSDAKSCILVTTCCEISCFLKNTAKNLRSNILLVPQPKSWGPISPGPYGCCAYAAQIKLLESYNWKQVVRKLGEKFMLFGGGAHSGLRRHCL